MVKVVKRMVEERRERLGFVEEKTTSQAKSPCSCPLVGSCSSAAIHAPEP
jgi:hypothetical protein